MAGMTPLALQSMLGDVNSRRALALALRQREEGPGQMVGGYYVPNLRGLGGTLARGLFGDPLDALRNEESAALGAYESELAGAMEGIVGAGTSLPDDEIGRRAARAQTAGVPQELIARALKRRDSWNLLNDLDAKLNAPMPSATAATSQGAPGPGIPSQGGPGKAAVAAAMAPQSTGTPLANVPDGKLITMAAVLDPAEPMAKLATAELEARKVSVKDGVITRQGRVIGKLDGGVFYDLATGQAHDLNAGIDAARAGEKAGAEERARFPFKTVETRGPRGEPVTAFASQLPGAPGGAQPAGGGKIKVNFEGSPDEVRQMVEAAIAEANRAGAAALGTGPAPMDVEREKAGIEVDAAGKKKQREAQITGGAARYEEITKAFQGAQDIRPIVAQMRKLDDSGVMNGPAQEVWKRFANFANSAIPGSNLDAARLANSQTFDAEISKMVQGIAKNFPGAQSDRELQQLLNSLPSRMQTPAARRQIYDALEARIAKIESGYRAASEHYRKHGDMIGWEAPSAPSSAPRVLRFDAKGNLIP